MKKKKIIILIVSIVLGLFIISAGIGYVIYHSAKKHISSKINDLQSRFFQYALPAKKKLLSLCPKDYDTTELGEAFDEYIKAFKTKSIRKNMIEYNLAPYLLQSLKDGSLSAEEADSLTVLFKKSVKR